MPTLTRKQVEQKAQRLLRESGQESAPVDVEQVAKHLNIRVEYANLDEDCSGVLVNKDDGPSVIGVNWDQHPNRQRFTIAHELGHATLGHEGGTFIDKGTYARFRDADSHSGKVSDERQANQFAAALLMPARLVQDACGDRLFDPADPDGLEELAREFAVSTQAMMFRLEYLGLLPARKRPF